MKTCTDCKENKKLEEFYSRPDVKSGDGCQSYCKSCCKNRKHAWYELTKYSHKVRYKNLKSSAKQRNLEVSISLKEFSELVSFPCHYCNASLEKHIGIGLDRKVNTEGYTLNNCVSCCTECNTGKGEFYSYEEWKIMVAALIKYREENGRGQHTRNAGPVRARTV